MFRLVDSSQVFYMRTSILVDYDHQRTKLVHSVIHWPNLGHGVGGVACVLTGLTGFLNCFDIRFI